MKAVNEIIVGRVNGVALFPMCQNRADYIYASIGLKIAPSAKSKMLKPDFTIIQIGYLVFIFTHDLKECHRLMLEPKEFAEASRDFFLQICPTPKDGKTVGVLMEKIGALIEAWRVDPDASAQKVSSN